MNNTDKWWAYKLQCILLYGEHPCLSYPLPDYVHINTAELCSWQKTTTHRMRNYFKDCERLGMLEDLKFTRGFVSCKTVQSSNSRHIANKA